MISDERAIIFCLGIVIIHHEMPKVGVVNHLHMRIVHDLVKFPPPLIFLYPPLNITYNLLLPGPNLPLINMT